MVKNSFYTMEKYQRILKGSALEIGSDRFEGSTEYFNNICQKNNVNFYSVDCEQGAYERAKSIVGDKAFNMKGEEFIAGLKDEKFSFVFLDNFDFFIPGVGDRKNLIEIEDNYRKLHMVFNNEESQKTHLLQAQLVQPFMMEDSIIGFDDTWQKPDGTFDGKGGTGVPWLLQNGYEILDEGRIADVVVGGYVILSKMKVPVRIKVVTCCKNEARILPFFLQYYSKIADEILVYDGGSDDLSVTIASSWDKVKVVCTGYDKELDERKLMKIRNEDCRIYKDFYDWLIIVDTDEFLYHPNLRRKLIEYKITGVTFPKVAGYNMRSMSFPIYDGKRTIIDIINTGVRDDKWQAKRCVFDPNKVFPIYETGCHNSTVTGDVVENRDPELMLLHYRWLGYKYFVNKNEFISNRLSDYNKENNFGYHTTLFSSMSEEKFESEFDKAYNIFDLKICLGNLYLDGYVRVVNYVNYVKIPYEDSSVIEIICNNMERFSHMESWDILKEFKRILVPGGRLIIETTNLTQICNLVSSNSIDINDMYRALYGDSTKDGQYKFTYTENQLAYQLIVLGFSNLSTSRAIFTNKPELTLRMECYK